jgi:FAD/FMN-containing dehydrogenase
MSPELIGRFAAIVGEANAIRSPADMAGYVTEWRGLWRGETALVMRPGCTEEVARILALATETRTAIVPQSGNTGLVGGQIPMAADAALLLSLDRMTWIVDVDAADNTMTVEAGVTLKSAQDAASAANRLFPLSLASEGSCRIGGNLSSNAGGLNTLAYGNARDLCLGVEVVLPDGRIWNGLRRLRKDNTGYDLKDLFVGAEGTLGIITSAVLKLFPKPARIETAFIAVASPDAALALLSEARGLSGNRVVAFELMPRIGLEFAVRHMGVADPLASASPWYVLCELADPSEAALQRILEEGLKKGWVGDAALAQSHAQRQSFWAVREGLSEAQTFEGGSIKHDISVPVSCIPAFIKAAAAAVDRFMPGTRLVCFGHMGDGNLHFNVSQPIGADKAAYIAKWQDMNAVVYNVVQAFDGSISAEHGIGRLKRADMLRIKSPVELQMMRDVKRLFDPLNIMNPHKTIPLEG